MAVPLEKFVQQLEDSGILAGETIKDFIPPKASPKDATELARELVRQKKITRFQAEEVSKGKGKSLTLGNYVLMEKIGAGGMGQVFKAEHRRMKRIVAIKLLPTAMTEDQAAIARFEREVEAAAKLRHPNIVAADDADCANGVHFLVMELVEGSDLAALVKQTGQFPVAQAIDCILQAARGLEFAHNEGVVHRDIKPANLLLDKKGVIKILDMGLARLSSDRETPTQAELTATGMVMGTVDYMAPEQALDTKTADARADIYALGCSLYFLLTGKSTYEGDTLMSKLLAHRDHPIPSLRAARPEVPEQLEAVFKKMVSKKVDHRYQSMTEVIAALQGFGNCQKQSTNMPQSCGTSSDTEQTEFHTDIYIAPPVITVQPKQVSGPFNTKGRKPLVLIGGAFFAVLILLAGLMVTLKTKDGTVIVTVNEPDADVQLLNEEDKVEVTRKGDKGPITITVDPGKHRLKVSKDGFDLFTKDFEIESGGKKLISAKLVPLDAKPATNSPATPRTVAGASKPLAFRTTGFDKWVEEVVSMPAQKQLDAVSKKLVELNPQFDGKFTFHHIRDGVVTDLTFFSDHVKDISPVRALQGLAWLKCNDSAVNAPGKIAQSPLSDLSPLQGMLLTCFTCNGSQVSDLTPLKGMPLTILQCIQTPVSDLSPLKEMPLTEVQCYRTPVSDLSPLIGCPLNKLEIQFTRVADLSPLRGMPLNSLNMQFVPVSDLSPLRGSMLSALLASGTKITDLSPLSGMPLTHLQIEETQVADLSPLKGMPLNHLQGDFTPISDLTPLQGLPLTSLYINATRVSDLAPLQGMRLTQLSCIDTLVTDLAPLKVMPLQSLSLDFTPDCDTTLLRSIKTLESINDKPVAEFYERVETYQAQAKRSLAFEAPGFDLWVKQTAALPAEEQVKAVSQKLQELNPGFDGTVTPTIDGGVVTGLQFLTDNVTDISPVRALGSLSMLNIHGSAPGKGLLVKLSPLKGLPLTALENYFTQVADLSPLQGMALTTLNCAGTLVSDLSPLKGMPLVIVYIDATRVQDLTILRGMPLKLLSIHGTFVRDLGPLKDMKLGNITATTRYITDFSPLKGMLLQSIGLYFNPDRDTEFLKSIKTLETINYKPAADFWKEVEAK